MTESRAQAREVHLRDVEDRDIDVFFDHQADPVAAEMAAFPSRGRDQFVAHWARIRADGAGIHRAVVVDGAVAGNVVSWPQDGQRMVGYWFGREHWGQGIATRALAQFVEEVPARPLYAHVVAHNAGSIRVLTKAGFRRDRDLEAQASPPEDGIDEFIFVLDAQP